MRRVNVMIGRFQPFTNGHMKCIEAAWEKLGVPTVICMVNTKDEKVDERKPFPSSLLLPLYEEEFSNDERVAKIHLVINADIVKIGESLLEEGLQICSWTCGTDRYDVYSKMAEKYAMQAHLAEDFQMIEVVRGDEDTSATKVRESLKNGNLNTFESLTSFREPNKIYDILKKYVRSTK